MTQNIQPQPIPPAKTRPRTKQSIQARDAAIAASKTHGVKERWVKYPDQHRWTSPKTAGTFKTRIERGDMWGEGFEATVRKGVLYVRFVG